MTTHESTRDPRQHRVSWASIVAVNGECAPAADALECSWITPEEACDELVAGETTSGHDALLRMALAHAGVLT